jgi:hypothetical protein
MFFKKKENKTGFYQDEEKLMEYRPNFFLRWTGRIGLVGIGAAGGYLAANHWPLSSERSVLKALTVMDQKLDLIWNRTSAGSDGFQNANYHSSVVELPDIQFNGGSIKLRFKRIGDAYHYECSIEGATDAISRLIAPNGKSVLLKATFADKDNFDLTDLTLSGKDFSIKEQGDGNEKEVSLDNQGVWENKVDPDQIKKWRIDVLDRDSTETKVGAAPNPSPNEQVKDLAADITVHPITGELLLPERLKEIENRVAQATPSPSPQASSKPSFEGPPNAMPTPKGSPNFGEPNVKVEEPNFVTPKPTPAEKKRNS